jgi:hypothetical protein
MNCQLEIENRRVRELKWVENMRNKLVKKEILDLELEEYFIPSTPSTPSSTSFTRSIPYSCSISSYSSTKGISEGAIENLDNFYCEHPINYCTDYDENNYSHIRDNCISSDSDCGSDYDYISNEEKYSHHRDRCLSSVENDYSDDSIDNFCKLSFDLTDDD